MADNRDRGMSVEIKGEQKEFIQSMAKTNGISPTAYTRGLLEKAIAAEKAEATPAEPTADPV